MCPVVPINVSSNCCLSSGYSHILFFFFFSCQDFYNFVLGINCCHSKISAFFPQLSNKNKKATSPHKIISLETVKFQLRRFFKYISQVRFFLFKTHYLRQPFNSKNVLPSGHWFLWQRIWTSEKWSCNTLLISKFQSAACFLISYFVD